MSEALIAREVTGDVDPSVAAASNGRGGARENSSPVGRLLRKDKDLDSTAAELESLLASHGLGFHVEGRYVSLGTFYSCHVVLDDYPASSNGKGLSEKAAYCSGLAELLERIQAHTAIPRVYGAKDADYAGIEGDGDCPVPPDDVAAALGDLMSHPLACFGHPFRDILDDTVVELPIRVLRAQCGTNGLCAGNTETEAIDQGLNEIFERHVRRRIATKDLRPRVISCHALLQEAPEVAALVDVTTRAGFGVRVLDCSDGQFPVVGVVLTHRETSSAKMILGADQNFSIAASRCFTEAFQGFGGDSAQALAEAAFTKVDMLDDYLNELSEGSRERLVLNRGLHFNAGEVPLNLLFDLDTVDSLPAVFGHPQSTADAFEASLGILRRLGRRLYVQDITTLGFPAYRLYVPGMTELYDRTVADLDWSWGQSDYLRTLFHLDEAGADEISAVTRVLGQLAERPHLRTVPLGEALGLHFLGDRFDILVARLDLIMALLENRRGNHESALTHMYRFVAENNALRHDPENLFALMTHYLRALARGIPVERARDTADLVFSPRTNNYVFHLVREGRLHTVLYYPACPDCGSCKYQDTCQYVDWKKMVDRINARTDNR